MTVPKGRIYSHYQAQIKSGVLQFDEAQNEAVLALDKLAIELESGATENHRSIPFSGVYLYGPVGRGKTMLMDVFYKQINVAQKRRLHFHHFMVQVHQQLNELQGQVDPLDIIANEWAKNTKIICFDEFFVSDIGDAMLMAGLFKALFEKGVVLVATSNCAPTALYKNGLQRSRFLPTIDLINHYCKVLEVAGQVDHRFRFGRLYTYYYIDCSEQDFISYFDEFSAINNLQPQTDSNTITICNRQVPVKLQSETAIMFDFMALCSGARSTDDYIYLASKFSRLYLYNVPVMGESATGKQIVHGIEDSYQRENQVLQDYTFDDEARRFIALVDEFYDRGKLVVIHAQVDIDKLYQGKRLAFEYCRTESRLVEMQTWQ